MSRSGPAGDPDSDTPALRKALGCFATGVTVVTTCGSDDRPRGFTANSFTSVSLDPPLVLVCVGQAVSDRAVYASCETFAINVLSRTQRALSDRFATESPDRFARVRWRKGSHGPPIVDDAVASLQCTPYRRIEAGDHMILIGRVLAFEHTARHPLVFFSSRYCRLAHSPEPWPDDDASHGGGAEPDGADLDGQAH